MPMILFCLKSIPFEFVYFTDYKPPPNSITLLPDGTNFYPNGLLPKWILEKNKERINDKHSN